MSEGDSRDRNAARSLDWLLWAVYADNRVELTQQAVPLVEAAYHWLHPQAGERYRLKITELRTVLIDMWATDLVSEPFLQARRDIWATLIRAQTDSRAARAASGGSVPPLALFRDDASAGQEVAKNRRLQVAGWILAIVIMWVLMLTAPPAIQDSHLSAETQQTLNDYYGVVAGIAMALTAYIMHKIVTERRK